MISVSEATSIILSRRIAPARELINLEDAHGRYLAQTVTADRDLPPFDRATMDGIAVASAAFDAGNRTFKINKVHAAGQAQISLKNQDECIEVMTGAVLPLGTDTIVRYEDLVIRNGLATINLDKIARGENIHVQGMDARKDSVLLTAGLRISPAEIAVMASVGQSRVEVFAFPKTVIISTGNELVPVDQTPAPYQIRQSNAQALEAALGEFGARPERLAIADEKTEMESRLKEVLSTHDLVILSGGVSKGKFDYVPQVMESMGIKKLFHGVSQKPGKPFWFGASDGKTVFALPGNPVSTFMCFYRFIRPWLIQSLGGSHEFPTAVLGADFTFKPELTFFLQVKIRTENGVLTAYPVPGGGSGDFANLKEVDGFLELPLEKSDFRKGSVFPLIRFRN